MNVGPLQFIVRGLRRGDGTATVRRLDANGDLDDGATDYADFAVHFRPPVARSRAHTVHVAATYRGNARVAERELFGRPLCPAGEEEKKVVVCAGALEYLCFDTHQVRVEAGPADEEVVCALYLRLENATCTTDPRYDLLLRAQVDVGHSLVPSLLSAHGGAPMAGLSWFPPDVDPAAWGLRVDPRTIPQRTALWFALRGQLTGSKAYKALGFFLPRDATSLEAGAPFSAASRVNMRRGTHAEPEATLLYALAHPDRPLRELGWCPAPKPHPASWGASPDMGASDPAAAPPDGLRFEDATRGVLEIKTSAKKTSMEDYFYPQVYMEMLATGSAWADVVRFRPDRPRGGAPADVAHVYRVWRDAALEERLLALWRRSLTNAHVIGAVVAEPAYREMRAELSAMARAATSAPTEVLYAADVPGYTEALTSYTHRLAQLTRPQRAEEDALAAPVEAELYERSLDVARAVQRHASRSEVAALVAHQVAALGQ